MKKSRIGILTGGGDCAGINPATKWVVKTALDDRLEKERGVQYEVLGIRDGWGGLIYGEPKDLEIQDGWRLIYGGPRRANITEYFIPLNQDIVRTWDRYGGTYLGTSRTNPYNPKDDQSKTVLSNIDKLGLDALIAIGGEDTLGVAYKRCRYP
jgi:6-phosphofructokinase